MDSRPDSTIPSTRVETRTDHDGRFEFPGVWAFKITRMDWLVWKLGFMPGHGSYRSMRWLDGASADPIPGGSNPWVRVYFTEHRDRIDAEFKIFPPTLEGVTFYGFIWPGRVVKWDRPPGEWEDPWLRYFREIASLVRERELPPEDFVMAAVAFTGEHEVTSEILSQMAQVESGIAALDEESPCSKAGVALALLELEGAACRRNPDLKTCDTTDLARRRGFLEERCGPLRHTADRD